MEKQRIITNTNGKSYKVLDEKGDFMLLELHTGEDYTPFVVAYLYREDLRSWNAGNYFDNYESARKRFDEKVI